MLVLGLERNERTFQEAANFILGAHSTLAIGDYEGFAELGSIRNEELDRAYNKAEGASAQQLMTIGEMAKDTPSWGMAQLNPRRFSLRMCGQNRLIECVNDDWKPILEELPDDEERITRYPMMIGKIDGEWRILR